MHFALQTSLRVDHHSEGHAYVIYDHIFLFEGNFNTPGSDWEEGTGKRASSFLMKIISKPENQETFFCGFTAFA